MTLFLLALGFLALAYQVAALVAALLHSMRPDSPGGYQPPTSILKPVAGVDEGFFQAIRSHAIQNYPEFEILFGVQSFEDPAVPAIRRLIEEFPDRKIRLIAADGAAPNLKVATLCTLSRHAIHPLLVVNDSDITVPQDYLARVVAPLADPGIGLVTCLYSADASSVAGRWEALGIATDFIPSTLVARMTGVREFGLGSTLCFRRPDLERIGGFEVLTDLIADDYQLAKRITHLGLGVYLSELSVSTHLSAPGWRAVWEHQVRWARTIRASRLGGFAGLPLTHAGLWALLAALGGLGWLAASLILARIASGLASGVGVLGRKELFRWFPLIPLWDLWAFAIWATAWLGDTVVWRGRRFRLHPGGRLEPL